MSVERRVKSVTRAPIAPSTGKLTAPAAASAKKKAPATSLNPQLIDRQAQPGQGLKSDAPQVASTTARTVTVGGRLPQSELMAYFDRLKALDRLGDSLDAVGAKGIMQLCEDHSCTPESLEFYTFVWKVGATRSGCITRSELLRCIYQYKIEYTHALKSAFTTWAAETLSDDVAFTDMYNHLYDFLRSDEEKLLSFERAARAWEVLFRARPVPDASMWLHWVRDEYRSGISRDLWRQLWKLLRKGLGAYRVEDQWPTSIDDFMVWYAARKT